jgi:hypothetical protein
VWGRNVECSHTGFACRQCRSCTVEAVSAAETAEHSLIKFSTLSK